MSDSDKFEYNIGIVKDVVSGLGFECKRIDSNKTFASFEQEFKNKNGKDMLFKIVCSYGSIRVIVVVEDETTVAQSGKYITPEELIEHRQDVINHNLWWVNEYNISVMTKKREN